MKFYFRMNKVLVFIFCVVITFTIKAENFESLDPLVAPDFKPDKELLEGGIWMVMDKIETDTKNSPTRLREQEINQYLNSILCRLAQDYCEDIRVYITRMPYFNATMAPNGMMTVWSGLLLRLDNESQLAAIIGHELGHYLRRHSLKQYEAAKDKASFGVFLSIALPGIGSIANLGLLASTYAHSRDSEREADKYGIQLMAQAGYDVSQASKVWQYIINEDEAKEGDDKNGVPFFKTHPDPEDRLSKLDEYAEQLHAQGLVNSEAPEDRFKEVVAPYWKTFLEDELDLNQPGKSLYLLNFLSKKSHLSGTVNYFKGEFYRRRKQDNDLQTAERHYLAALNFEDVPHETHRGLGMVYLKQKNKAKAIAHFEKYIELMPEANDRQMIEFYMNGG